MPFMFKKFRKRFQTLYTVTVSHSFMPFGVNIKPDSDEVLAIPTKPDVIFNRKNLFTLQSLQRTYGENIYQDG